MQKNTQALLHLSLIKDIGPASVLKIIQVLHEDFCAAQRHPHLAKPTFNLESLYTYKHKDFIEKFGVSSRIAQLLVTGLGEKKVFEQELTLIEKYKITTLSFLDNDYPESLKQIYHPPLVIYYKGSPLHEKTKRLAIVGSRKADHYARTAIEKLVPDLIDQSWEIVSGGAIGVDSIAHQKTLVCGGKTIAVLGSGLTNPYPAVNKELFRSIIKNKGTLLSPFPLTTPPSRGNFPARNRVISGLSKGCIVVQAAKKSGALITADFALNQGKQVFAIPGPIDHPLFAGCNSLIQQGAKLVTSSNDIFEEFSGLFKSKDFGHNPQDERVQQEEIYQEPAPEPFLAHLTRPCSIDELAAKTGLTLGDLQNKLFELQLEGKIKQLFSGLWERE